MVTGGLMPEIGREVAMVVLYGLTAIGSGVLLS